MNKSNNNKNNNVKVASKIQEKKNSKTHEKLKKSKVFNHKNLVEEPEGSITDEMMASGIADSYLPDTDELFINALDISRSEIFNQMNDYIYGQDEAIKSISLLAKKQLIRADNENLPIKKENYMLIGETGSGKSGIINALDKCLPVPVIVVDSSNITPSGYKGVNVNELLFSEFLNHFEEDYFRHSIIVFDEFDKLINKNDCRSNPSYSRMCQSDLLRIIEGTAVYGGKSQKIAFDTTDMVFMFAGAFDGCFEQKNIVIGESKRKTKSPTIKDDKFVRKALKEYGVMPELLGRIGNFSILNKLDAEAHVMICKTVKNSVIDSYKHLCKTQDGKFIVHKEALFACAKEAVDKGLGVRGMEAIIDKAVSSQICELLDGKRKEVHLTLKSIKRYASEAENSDEYAA